MILGLVLGFFSCYYNLVTMARPRVHKMQNVTRRFPTFVGNGLNVLIRIMWNLKTVKKWTSKTWTTE